MDLAYFVAYKKRRFGWAARLAAQSLRTLGKFSGEIIIFSDRSIRVCDSMTRVVVVNDPQIGTLANRMKMLARKHVNFSRYERVLFLDSDILMQQDVNPILEQCRDGLFVCTDDLHKPLREGGCWRALSEEEVRVHGERLGVNGGFFVAEGAVIDRYLAAWQTGMETFPHRPGPGFDQPALNACIVRGLIPAKIVENIMWFPHEDPHNRIAPAHAPLIHYHGIGRHLGRYWRMRSHWLRLRNTERIRCGS